MKIEVSDFYKKQGYSNAYLFTNNKGRRCVELQNRRKKSGGNVFKRFISYAKYLWESANETFVPQGYEVDHIDGNGTNDVLSNLQVISKKENIRKMHKQNNTYGLTMCDMICPVCGKGFKKELKFAIRVNKQPACCCRSCSTTLQAKKIKFDKRKYVDYCKKISYKCVNELNKDKKDEHADINP